MLHVIAGLNRLMIWSYPTKGFRRRTYSSAIFKILGDILSKISTLALNHLERSSMAQNHTAIIS
jgi:hypothetical protein